MEKDKVALLTARYHINFRTPELSQRWGAWESDQPVKHLPGTKLPNNLPDIASVYIPTIGVYDSCDPVLMEYHILLAKAAGIQSFTIDWSGPEHEKESNIIKILLTIAEQLQFKIMLNLQIAKDDAPEKITTYLNHANAHYIGHKAYQHFQDKPVFFITTEQIEEEQDKMIKTCIENSNVDYFFVKTFRASKAFDFSVWQSVCPIEEQLLFENDYDPEYWEKCEKSRGQGVYGTLAGMVAPGFDNRALVGKDHERTLVCSRRQGEKYSTSWESNLTHDVQIILIESWNRFDQGTVIEPVKEVVLHKQTAAPGWGYRELITTREYARQFTNSKLWALPSLFLPERLYHLRRSDAPQSRGDRIRLYLLEGDVAAATLALEQAGV